jgi:hypothetical protein
MRTINPPFHYEPSGDSDGEAIWTDHFVLDSDGEELCCPPNEAIARLFAAAPDLLEAVREMLPRYVEMFRACNLGDPTTDGVAVPMAMKAIAKATGGPITEEPTDVPDPF